MASPLPYTKTSRSKATSPSASFLMDSGEMGRSYLRASGGNRARSTRKLANFSATNAACARSTGARLTLGEIGHG